MKQFKFQNKASLIRGIKEEKPKKRTNWDRIIYLAIFIVMIASFALYILQRNITASAMGEVITDRFDVMEARDMKILAYFVGVGDEVKTGDTLFRYRTDFRENDNDAEAGITLTNPERTSDWMLREITNTRKNIQLRNIDINDLKQRVQKAENEIERLKLEVYLDVYSPAILKQQRLLLADYNVQLQKNREELSYLYTYLRQLEAMQIQEKETRISIQTASTGRGEAAERFYISPVNGVVTHILTPEHGITYKKDAAMYISNHDKVFIKVYVEQRDLEYFRINDEVKLRFMDGTRSSGVIRDLYVNTEETPEEFREIRGKLQRNVIAEVMPMSETERQQWVTYYKFTVKVMRYKFL